MSKNFYDFLAKLSREVQIAYFVFACTPREYIKPPNDGIISNKSAGEPSLIVLCYVIMNYRELGDNDAPAKSAYENMISYMDEQLYSRGKRSTPEAIHNKLNFSNFVQSMLL